MLGIESNVNIIIYYSNRGTFDKSQSVSKSGLFIFMTLLPVCKFGANKYKPKFNLNLYRNYVQRNKDTARMFILEMDCPEDLQSPFYCVLNLLQRVNQCELNKIPSFSRNLKGSYNFLTLYGVFKSPGAYTVYLFQYRSSSNVQGIPTGTFSSPFRI